MDLDGVLLQLHLELEHINVAIQSLERLAVAHSQKKGRPPKETKTKESPDLKRTAGTNP